MWRRDRREVCSFSKDCQYGGSFVRLRNPPPKISASPSKNFRIFFCVSGSCRTCFSPPCSRYFSQFGELSDLFLPLRNPHADPPDGMHKGRRNPHRRSTRQMGCTREIRTGDRPPSNMMHKLLKVFARSFCVGRLRLLAKCWMNINMKSCPQKCFTYAVLESWDLCGCVWVSKMVALRLGPLRENCLSNKVSPGFVRDCPRT